MDPQDPAVPVEDANAVDQRADDGTPQLENAQMELLLEFQVFSQMK